MPTTCSFYANDVLSAPIGLSAHSDREMRLWPFFSWLILLLVFMANSAFAGQVNLAWNASSGPVSGYKVYYGTASGNYTSNLNAGSATSATVASLADGSTYYFAVKAYDSTGNESSFSNEVNKSLTVAAPVASFSADKTSGTAPVTVNLADTSTGTITGRAWDLGDGTTSTAQSVAKTYNAAGSYTVKLTVTNAGGSSTTTKTISATASAPVANFTASPSSGIAPLPVTFSNSSAGTVVSYSWNFGDNTSSTAQNPSHTYANAGTYTVTLTATGASGTTPSTKTQTITVSAASASAGGLVAAYNFEEASGATVVDVSGKGNHGTVSGATRTTAGKFGRALSFDGVDDWVTINDSASLDLTNGMTLEAWVYPTDTMSGWQTVLNKEQPDGFGAAYYLAANSDLNQPEVAVYTTDWYKLYGGPALSANKWVHLVGTYDGSTMKLYVNGSQVSSQQQAGGIDVTNGVLRIGGNSYWGEFFKGRIDEIRIYNRALSATEIKSDMNTAIKFSSPPKLLLGEQALGSASDSLAQGTAAAFQTTASVTGQITGLPVYVDASSASTKLIAGLYADSNGRPGARLATGTLSSPKAGSWNTVALPATNVTAGTKYWIAILSASGELKFRDKVGSASLNSETSKSASLTSLPTTWSTGTVSANGPLSGYGAGY